MALTSSGFTAPMTKNVKLRSSVYETIIQVGPDETPILSKIGTSSVTNPLLHSWLTDTLAKPKQNKNLEITGLTEVTKNTVQKTSNATQIFKTEAMVSDSLLKARQYGGNEMAYQMGKKAKEHKLDIEYALFGLGRDSDTKVSVFKEYVQANESVEGEMAGMFYYIAKDAKSFSDRRRGNVLAFDENGDWTGNATELTEDKLNQILQSIWDKGVTAKDVFVGADLKAAINRIATRILGNEKTSIETDFGVVNFHLHRMLSKENNLADYLIAGDFSFMKHGLYIPTKISEVPTDKTALAKRIFTQGTLEVRNADAFAIAVGLSSVASKKMVSVYQN
ncbi:DUF5309 family protein [Campylobacter sp. US33a]|uniref:SU10 major capsid protein n=1 Tax=Campylobacter sp. US33a TaxID=2498120 RepID=UPI001068A7D6|nr:DUF5309 family protein [Campylobacter sp. US33a]TEY00966.1 hypothetical protein ELQ16_08265 [Campylobacter sp. US33a]